MQLVCNIYMEQSKPIYSHIEAKLDLFSLVVHWLELLFRISLLAGSNPVEDGQGNELFGEIALKNQRLLSLFYYWK